MITRVFYRIQQTLGLTHVEAMAALVLGVALLSGSFADWALSHADEADYTEADATFAALVSTRQHVMDDGENRIRSVGLASSADSASQEAEPPAGEFSDAVESRPRRTSPAPRPAPHSININTAAAGELTRLSGIGPVLAARIVENRSTHGPFRSASDLIRVKGIGEKTFQKMEPYVTL